MVVKTDVCVMTGATRDRYSRGDIISVPVHKVNRNPRIDLTDSNLTKTKIGGVYSKRRMVVVMYITCESMFCLPLHTFDHKGLQSKPNGMRREFVCVKNEDDAKFVNQSINAPAEANCNRPLDPLCVINLADHIEVGCQDGIVKAGEMTDAGFTRLLALWEGVVSQAKKEPRKQQQQRPRRFGAGGPRASLAPIQEGA